ncbi:hypothetical protein VFPFJ_08678 [Purpureocillium lilacinum]|uniref:Uncharacterized protein n=1 Tax=Purpureocillium lilacinum TaxID=33203 RepID=A0A179GY27_PURLI|nr:hypothetical protein VFPFJ_08678 [Purpureocillium lilacinum]OAQ82875.1 hypothetical protein VFPFJ_08678 [Purpureocillium lilacinum]
MQDEINPVVVDPVRRATSALPLTQRRLVVEMYNKRGPNAPLGSRGRRANTG